MHDKRKASLGMNGTTRRQMIFGSSIVLGSLALGLADAQDKSKPKMAEVPSTGAEEARTSLHQEIDFTAAPQRIYEVLLDSKQFSAVTGMPAEISREAGGALTMFGGLIMGRNIELVPSHRIVQAWRPASWNPGVYSIVKFELQEKDSQTTLVLDHTGFPEGDYGHLYSGWHERYWEPLKKYLA